MLCHQVMPYLICLWDYRALAGVIRERSQLSHMIGRLLPQVLLSARRARAKGYGR